MDTVVLIGVIIGGLALIVTILIHLDNKRRDKRDDKWLEVYSKALDKIPDQITKDTVIQPPENYEQIEQKANELIKRKGYINGWDLLKIGNVEYSKSNYLKAQHYFEVSLDQAKERKERELEAVALGNLSLVFYEKPDFDKAIELSQKAKEINIAIGRKRGYASNLNNLIMIYQERQLGDDLDTALVLFEEAIKIYDSIKEKDVEGRKKGLANLYGNIGLVYKKKGDLKQAMFYYEQSLELHKKTENDFGVASCLGNIGILKRNNNELDEAL
ncbi:MAG: tetratricopeptide repeat protein, partial [candidate division Zixibacteria bacterium]|nr:tetratricopeptide repeat protein [candidate division Zixibacteria bacterium]